MHSPSFLTCKRCFTVQWMTMEYLNYYGRGAGQCRVCRANDWRDSNTYPTLRERIYLLRWFLWQQWYVNLPGNEGADPWWWVKPWFLAKAVWYGLNIMRDYNTIAPEGDDERPGNIKALRAELSQHDADADRGVPDATLVLSRQRSDTV